MGPAFGQTKPAMPAVHPKEGEPGASPPLEDVPSPLDRVKSLLRIPWTGRTRARMGGGGAQTAKRHGGHRDTVSRGDAYGMRGRKSRGIARKRWQIIPLLTTPPGVGG